MASFKNESFFMVERAKRAKPFYPLAKIIPLLLPHKALLHRYQGQKVAKSLNFFLVDRRVQKVAKSLKFCLVHTKVQKVVKSLKFYFVHTNVQKVAQSLNFASLVQIESRWKVMMVSLAPFAQPQRTAPFSEFRGGRPCLDIFNLILKQHQNDKKIEV